MQTSTISHWQWHKIFALVSVKLCTRISREMCYNKEGWNSLTQKEKILAEPLRQEVQDKAVQEGKLLTTFKIKLGWGRSKLHKIFSKCNCLFGRSCWFLRFCPISFSLDSLLQAHKGYHIVRHGEWSLLFHQSTNPNLSATYLSWRNHSP